MIGTPLLQVCDVTKEFHQHGRIVHAVQEVSLQIAAGETVGLVGESGCGKSTLARLIVRLDDPTSGRVMFDGQDLTRMPERRLRHVRKDVQIVFQDPTTALNPSWSVRHLIAEPLHLHGVAGGDARVQEVLNEVELTRGVLHRRPGQLSVGQRQRVAIARAIVTRPRFIVLDEPTASVDMSIRLSLLGLLRDLQREYGLTYLFISHDLSTVRHLCDRVLVMYMGRVVEYGPTAGVFADPAHVYTRILLSAIPIPDPTVKPSRLMARGEPPSPTEVPSGCPFRTRCPEVVEICAQPQAFARVGPGHEAACRLASERRGEE
ncbi:MAG: ABC transporter ATP-binding protein [Candidatus Dormiibacterota bacterium]